MVFPGERDIRGSADYYIDHPARQPKREISDYVKSCGIPVPRRFASLDEAVSSGKPFIIRSEHPQDYNGASGIADSLFVLQKWISKFGDKYRGDLIDWKTFFKEKHDPSMRRSVEEQIIGQIGRVSQIEIESYMRNLSHELMEFYCKYTGLSLDKFIEDQHYSYWELLGGLNRAIVADSAIKGRYHVFTKKYSESDGKMISDADGYEIIENGGIIAGERGLKISKESERDFDSLIEFYESVRHLDRFDKDHCPIIEAQTVEDDQYFLQYHKSVNFKGSTFVLDREFMDGEVEAPFVRGATSPDGLIVTGEIYYWPKMETGGVEDAAINFSKHPYFIEAFIRKRKLQIIKINNIFSALFLSDNSHLPRSELFKPEISVILLTKDFEKLNWQTNFDRKKPNPKFKIRIISDGRKAYIKLVE